jgi:hypothetical protein
VQICNDFLLKNDTIFYGSYKIVKTWRIDLIKGKNIINITDNFLLLQGYFLGWQSQGGLISFNKETNSDFKLDLGIMTKVNGRFMIGFTFESYYKNYSYYGLSRYYKRIGSYSLVTTILGQFPISKSGTVSIKTGLDTSIYYSFQK